MFLKDLTFGIAISFISWTIGIIFDALINKSQFYKERLSNFNFLTSASLNKAIGLDLFKWVVKNTFFKFLNQKLKLKNKIEVGDLHRLRHQMTIAEIGHLFAFVFASGFAVWKFAQFKPLAGLMIILVNVILNMYPSLLQQENKRRIDALLKRLERSKNKQNSTS